MIWPAPQRGIRLRECVGWGMAAASAALPLSLMLIWAGGQTGQDRGHVAAQIFDLAPLPPVLVQVEPPPAPEPKPPLEPTPEPEPDSQLPPLPDLPPLPEPAPVVLPDAAPEPLAAVPDTRPKSRPQLKPQVQPKPTLQQSAVSGPTRAVKPAAQVAARKGNATLEADWGAAIRKKIERRKAYPKAAKGAVGRVTLRMTVAQNGRLEAMAVVQSSGNAALDDAAVAAVRRAGQLPAAPKGLETPAHVFTLPMDFAP